MKIFAVAVFAAAGWGVHVSAQPAVGPPQMGFVQDRARSLRPAYGVPGNFILGPSLARRVVNEAFSGSLGLVKTDASLVAFDTQGKLLGSIGAAAGTALFGFSPDGATGIAYIASSNALIEWSGDAFTPLSISLEQVTPDLVLGLALVNAWEMAFLVERDNAIWQVQLPLDNTGTASQTALNGVHAPLLLLPSGDLVYADSDGIVIRRADASEVHVIASLPADFSLQQMTRDWVQLTDVNSFARFAIRATPGREAFYQLPESARK